MKKAVFTKKWFYWFMIVFFSILLVASIFNIIQTQRFNIFPILILGTVLWLTISKNKFSKIVLQIFNGFVTILLLIQLVFYISDKSASLKGYSFFIGFILFEVLIIIVATKTIKIEEAKDDSLEENDIKQT